jgi:PAS domain S-box-containing protein
MSSARILIVEDEGITAKDIAETLKSQGYDVPAIALSGEEAIQKTEAIRPDLVLMDIVLKGNVDGIAAARQIRDRFDIPVVYLTAYADSEIVKRARITEPFGYIIKPFEARELHSNIEMALYKHKAEKALRQAEQEKAIVLGSMSEPVIHQDLAHKVILANRAAGDSVGLSAKELVGRHCYEIWQGRDKPCVGCPVVKARETGRLQSAEMVSPEGKIWSVRGYPVKDVKGAVTGVVEVTENITERKKAEQKLRESEARYRNLFEQSPLGIGLATPDGRVAHVNKTMEVITGYFKEELKKINLADTYENPQDRKKLLGTIERYGCAVDFPTRLKRKNGTVYDAILNVSRVRFGDQDFFQTICMDVTDRKRAEEAYRSLVDHSLQGLAIFQDGRVVFANEAMAEIAGYTVEEIMAMSPEEVEAFVHPEDRGLVWSRHRDRLKGQKLPEQYEFRGIRKNGSVCWLEIHASRIEYQGKPAIQAAYIDVTERKRAEEALRESEEKYRELFENAGEAIIAMDLEGNITGANKLVEEYGYLSEQLIGKSNFDFIAEQHKAKAIKEFERVIHGDLIRGESEVLTPKGSIIVEYRDNPIRRQGQIVGMQTILTNITKRKQAEAELRASRDYLEGLTNSMWDAVFSVKMPERVIEWVNDSYKLIGYESQECIGRTTEFIYPDKSEFIDFGNKLKKAIEAGEDILHAEQLLRRKNGETFPAEITTTIFREKGQVTRITSIVRDVTGRKDAEKRLLDYQEQLKSLASQLTLTEEQERRRIATELHDNITQSLAMSKLKLDLMLDSKSSSATDFDEVLNETSKNIEQIMQEVRTLTFDLSSSVLYELGFESAVAEWLTERIQKEHYIATEFEDDGQPKPLDDDTRTVLFRDVRELLTNVVKHAQAKNVKVSIRKVGSRIHVSVEDDGRGFDPERAAAAAAKNGVFGLFSIRERLKQLGGNIEIESASGHGTRVTLVAPLKNEG